MLPLALMGAGLVGQGISGYLAYQRQKEAEKALEDIESQELPRYALGRGWNQYGQLALQDIYKPQGYTGAETGKFYQDLAKIQAQGLGAAQSYGGGNLSRALLAQSTGQGIGALNQFAAQNAALARQARAQGLSRFGQYAGQEQAIANANIAQDIARRKMLEEYYGQAARQNRDYWQGLIGGMGSQLLGAGANLAGAGYLKGLGGTTTPTDVTAPYKTFAQEASKQTFVPSGYDIMNTYKANRKLYDLGMTGSEENPFMGSGYGTKNYGMLGANLTDNLVDYNTAPYTPRVPVGYGMRILPSNANPFSGNVYDAMDAYNKGILGTGYYRK